VTRAIAPLITNTTTKMESVTNLFFKNRMLAKELRGWHPLRLL
jgi:hypothetical protein